MITINKKQNSFEVVRDNLSANSSDRFTCPFNSVEVISDESDIISLRLLGSRNNIVQGTYKEWNGASSKDEALEYIKSNINK